MQTAENWLEYCAAEMSRAGLFFGHGTDNAHDEAAWMLLHVLQEPLNGSFEQWDIVLNDTQVLELESLLARRINERLPLAYLTGEARFCGLNFIVSPDVLIPRSPFAELIFERLGPWVNLGEGGSVLDMCTGGACIAIATIARMQGFWIKGKRLIKRQDPDSISDAREKVIDIMAKSNHD